MPWASITYPSIQLGILKGLLDGSQLPCAPVSLNLAFFEYLAARRYRKLHFIVVDNIIDMNHVKKLAPMRLVFEENDHYLSLALPDGVHGDGEVREEAHPFPAAVA